MLSYQVIEFGAPLERREMPTPEPTGREALVRVEACGVCHTDIHLWEGYYNIGDGKKLMMADRGISLPRTPGHEIVGRVEKTGPEAVGVSPGDEVLVFPWIGCGECPSCAAGEERLCLWPRYLGVFRDGGYSDYVLVPDTKYLVDFSGLSKDLACTCACSSLTAFGALKKISHLRAPRKMAIIGAGGLGLACLRLAPVMTDMDIIVADIDAAKREAAKAIGATEVLDPSGDGAPEALQDWTGGGPEAVIDFVGSEVSTEFALGSLPKGGLLVVVGLYGGVLNIPLPSIPLRYLTITASFVGTLSQMKELLDVVRKNRIEPPPVTTRPLATAHETLMDLKAGRIIGRAVLVT